ncbi:WAT1-related protein [Hibiscus syriacus]|uniref:WAT1-related protein n=2 Tax=Hibiscus syriacus TaxID=106335 RepID=A0A6A3D6Z7_HIBSY|nr:WAT1-related protein [Hibiscus syriacus]
MLMSLMNGPKLQLPWTNSNHHQISSTAGTQQHPIRGAIMITVGCFCWASFIVLQATTLKSYPAELSLTALICLAGTIQGSIVALIMDAGNPTVWYIHFDSKLLAAVYSGILCSGLAYYIQGTIMRSRGPVFVTAFNPLSTVIVAILSSFILSETLYLGRVIGAIVIVIGLYLVLWGKSQDQPLSSLSIETKEPNDLKIISAIDGITKVSDQELFVLDLASNKVTPTDEYV